MPWGRGRYLANGRQLAFLYARHQPWAPWRTVPRILPEVSYSSPQSVSIALFTTSSSQSSGSEQHALFLQQLQELEKERKQFFGDEHHQDHDNDSSDRDNEFLTGATTTARLPGEPSIDNNSTPLAGDFELDMEELHAEREALFQFTSDEKDAWKSQSTASHGNPFQARLSPQLFKDIEAARAAAARNATTETDIDATVPSTQQQDQHHESFSHISKDSQSIHMVDVGQKQITTRTARAQSIIRLPPEVIEAFQIQQSSSSSSSELVGPKGPIFATAKLAGIMAAKKTSDLIPLCHPLPLDQVQLDVRMSSDNPHEIIVECTCRVTHKTGVEMEALTGASVAALTIYDMVKAVSHKVEITSIRLLSKTGGKRNIVEPSSNP